MPISSLQIGIPVAGFDRPRRRCTAAGRLAPRMLLLPAVVAVMALLPCPRSIAAVPALCADAPNQAEGTICAAGKQRAAESALAQAYAALDAKLDPLGKRNLKLAQSAWLKFRDLECNLETGHDPDRVGREGTIMPMLLGECATAVTEQRTRDLAGQVKCPGGNLSCEQ